VSARRGAEGAGVAFSCPRPGPVAGGPAALARVPGLLPAVGGVRQLRAPCARSRLLLHSYRSQLDMGTWTWGIEVSKDLLSYVAGGGSEGH
jgi:hypothetical protein